MRTKTLLSISLLSFAAVATACSRHKVAAAPTPNNSASASQAATEAAERANAQLGNTNGSTATDDAERTARNRAADRAAITTPVYFAFDRSDITDEGLQTLDQKVDALQRNSSVRVRIEGNADDSGSDEYNLALSQRRAAVAHRYLTDRGIDASRLTVVSYGEERPACTISREEDCRSKNRRDEFVILSGM